MINNHTTWNFIEQLLMFETDQRLQELYGTSDTQQIIEHLKVTYATDSQAARQYVRRKLNMVGIPQLRLADKCSFSITTGDGKCVLRATRDGEPLLISGLTLKYKTLAELDEAYQRLVNWGVKLGILIAHTVVPELNQRAIV
ncbi:MAG: hypothetical protein CL489_06380 [Acidobacteria bacterium]|nr:hypothetical protein [Acidobacteriota bacterium]|tara:strand:- start:50971 stop:51396 length:426 start_codon:yes stop_codon:yes gene_type:complete